MFQEKKISGNVSTNGSLLTRREIISESWQNKPRQDCNYPFQIDLSPNGM